jgi:hypothetical protein
MTYDVYLYHDASDDAQTWGSDEIFTDYPSRADAEAEANRFVQTGQFARAIVGYGDSVTEVYDTGAIEPEEPLPVVAPLGPRSRRSPLAERVLCRA